MPLGRAAASAAVHAAVAAVSWQRVLCAVEVAYPSEEVAAGRVSGALSVAAVEAGVSRVRAAATVVADVTDVTPAGGTGQVAQGHGALAGTTWIKASPEILAATVAAAAAGGLAATVENSRVVIVVPNEGISFSQLVHSIKVYFDFPGQLGEGVEDEVFAEDLEVFFHVEKVVDDVVGVTDVFTFALALNEILFSDEAVTSDEVVKAIGKVLADASSALDALARLLAISKADSATASDAKALDVGKSGIADSVTPADSKVVDLGKVLGDSVTVLDVVSGVFNDTAITGELVFPTDAIQSFFVDKVLADIATPTDARSVLITMGTLADSVIVLDATSFSIGFIRFFGCEEVSSTLNGHALNEHPLHVDDQCEHVVVGDSIPIFAFAKALADSAVPAEAMVFDAGKALADSVTATDAVVSVFGRGTVAEFITVTDAVVKDYAKPVTESVTATDASAAAYLQALTESVLATEAVAKAIAQAVADSVSAADAFVAGFDISRFFGCVEVSSALNGHMLGEWPLHVDDQCEHVLVGDGVVFGITKSALAEFITPVDAPAKDITRGTISESVTAIDQVVSVLGKGTVNDAVLASDVVVISLAKVLAEVVTVADLAIAAAGGKPEWNEPLFNQQEFN